MLLSPSCPLLLCFSSSSTLASSLPLFLLPFTSSSCLFLILHFILHRVFLVIPPSSFSSFLFITFLLSTPPLLFLYPHLLLPLSLVFPPSESHLFIIPSSRHYSLLLAFFPLLLFPSTLPLLLALSFLISPPFRTTLRPPLFPNLPIPLLPPSVSFPLLPLSCSLNVECRNKNLPATDAACFFFSSLISLLFLISFLPFFLQLAR